MQKEIVVNSTPNEIRIGIVEDHELVELLTESADSTRMVGNLYKGRITAVRPGLQAAFVDIGFDKAGFLHVSDLLHEDPEEDDSRRTARRGRGREGMRPIERMVKEGDEILVQVAKEAIGTKGPRLTADVSLPGRFLVLMPKGSHVGVSRKIADRRERGRLKEMLASVKAEEGAFIIRTAGEGIDEKMLRQDVDYLTETWAAVKEQMAVVPAPGVVHEDVGLITGLIRDVLTEDVDAVYLDSQLDYEQLKRYVKKFSPELLNRIKLYTGEEPIFEKFNVESELKKSLERKVWMKKGGYIVIDQTEALVAIDVNTGRFTGKRNQEETIFKTNMLAAREVPRQLRLRDIGGIVVIDFIDMESESNKRKVLAELRNYLKRDRARTKTFSVSDLGLVEMSRQRVRESLQYRLSDECPFCKGTGHIFSLETLCNKVERLLSKAGLVTQEAAIQVQANPSLAVHLLTERGAAIEKIARDFNMKIDILDDARIHREEFKIVSMRNRKDLTSQLENAAWKGTSSRRRRVAAQAESGASTDDIRSSSRPARVESGRSEGPDRSRGDSPRSRDGRSPRRDDSSRRRDGAARRDDSSRRDGAARRDDSSRRDGAARRDDSSRRDGAARRDDSSRRDGAARRDDSSRREDSSRRDGRGRPESPRGRSANNESTLASSSVAPPSVSESGEEQPRKGRRRRGRRGRGRGRGSAASSQQEGAAVENAELATTEPRQDLNRAREEAPREETRAGEQTSGESTAAGTRPDAGQGQDENRGDSRRGGRRSRGSRGGRGSRRREENAPQAPEGESAARCVSEE